MTNYLLPETDRLAADVNPLFEQVADLTDVQVLAGIEAAAITVTGLVSESVADLRDETVRAGEASGVPAEVAGASFDMVFDRLLSILQPRITAFNEAVGAAAERAMQKQAEDALNALFERLGVTPDEAVEPEPAGVGYYL